VPGGCARGTVLSAHFLFNAVFIITNIVKYSKTEQTYKKCCSVAIQLPLILNIDILSNYH